METEFQVKVAGSYITVKAKASKVTSYGVKGLRLSYFDMDDNQIEGNFDWQTLSLIQEQAQDELYTAEYELKVG